jgi:hypothetical protein
MYYTVTGTLKQERCQVLVEAADIVEAVEIANKHEIVNVDMVVEKSDVSKVIIKDVPHAVPA